MKAGWKGCVEVRETKGNGWMLNPSWKGWELNRCLKLIGQKQKFNYYKKLKIINNKIRKKWKT